MNPWSSLRKNPLDKIAPSSAFRGDLTVRWLYSHAYICRILVTFRRICRQDTRETNIVKVLRLIINIVLYCFDIFCVILYLIMMYHCFLSNQY